MKIDWDEVNRVLQETDNRRARQLATRAALRQVATAAKYSDHVLRGQAERRQLEHVEHDPAERRQLLAALFDSDLVRQAVSRELRQAEQPATLHYAREVSAALEAPDPDAARRLLACHDPEHMSIGIHQHPEGPVMVKSERRRCWLRVCPKCARDHAARLRARYDERIRQVSMLDTPGCQLKMLVLTMPRGPNLRADLARLHRNTKKLVKHFWGGKGQGAFATAEVGPRGGNVHVHCIVYGRYVRQSAISDYWRAITGDSFIVWVKACTPSQGVREGIKYITKLSGRDDDGNFKTPAADLAELHVALKGRRRVWAWGAFYGLQDLDADAAPEGDETGDEHPAGDKCKCGERMIFITMPEARALLSLKDANNCRSETASAPSAALMGGPPS